MLKTELEEANLSANGPALALRVPANRLTRSSSDQFRRAENMELSSKYGDQGWDAPSATIFVAIDGSWNRIADHTSADGVEHMLLINDEPAIADSRLGKLKSRP